MATKEQVVIKRARDEIEKRTGKTPEQLYEEREKRVVDAIALKEPDRVPIFLTGGSFPASYAGLPQSAAFYDADAYREATIKTVLDFEPDMGNFANRGTDSGLAMEALDLKQFLWPGGPLRADQGIQFIDMEMMKENEYDLFLTDPTDFVLRRYLPRAFGALEPLSKLPPLGQSFVATGAFQHMMTSFFAEPGFQKAAKAIYQAVQEQRKFGEWGEEKVSAATGTPPLTYPGGVGGAPYDFMADRLRGMSGIMIDMFKRPEKLHSAMEKILEWRMARAVPADPKKRGRRVSGGALHWGSEAFLTKKQYGTFYWPSWKKTLMASIDLGFVPVPFCEGKFDDRIDHFLELPKGKAFIRFEVIDMVRAKEILGGHLCIGGGVPYSLLCTGSPQEVEEYCKNLIKACKKGGGFILGSPGGIDDAKPANVKAMMDSAKKYGRY